MGETDSNTAQPGLKNPPYLSHFKCRYETRQKSSPLNFGLSAIYVGEALSVSLLVGSNGVDVVG